MKIIYIRKVIIYCIILLSTTSSLSAQQVIQKLQSPDGAYEFVLNTEEGLFYSIRYKESVIVANSRMGFLFGKGDEIDKNFKIKNVKKNEVESSWRPVYGERSEYLDVYSEVLIRLEKIDSETPNYNVRVRAYNEGVAFRYEFSKSNKKVVIRDELTEFALSPEAVVWASTRAQSEIIKMPIEQISEAVERPLLVELPRKCFIAIGEAGLVDFSDAIIYLQGVVNGVVNVTLLSNSLFNT